MASIGSRTFNLVEDKYLTLGNEEYFRTLSLGSNWTKLRLGMMVALPPNGTNNLIDCSLFLGVCAGASPLADTAGYGAATATNVIGVDFFTQAAAPLGLLYYTAGSGNPYYPCAYLAARRRPGARRWRWR